MVIYIAGRSFIKIPSGSTGCKSKLFLTSSRLVKSC
jgi:hypothetical protein